MFNEYIHAEKSHGGSTSYETVSIPLANDCKVNHPGKSFPKDKLATYGFMQISMIRVLGRVLTTLDAAITESRQNKAVKDLIKTSFYSELDEVAQMLLDQEAMQKLADEHYKDVPLEVMEKDSISRDEVYGLEEK